jgi:hypothetical protein
MTFPYFCFRKIFRRWNSDFFAFFAASREENLLATPLRIHGATE